MAFFSVILPVYNKANFLKDSINSILNQSFKDFELIIVNDGSTDQSLDVIKQFSDQRIKLYNQDNLGASAARNKGIEMADSEWIALLDADDIWLKHHLEEIHQTILKLPKARLVSTAYKIQLTDNYFKNPIYSKTIPKGINYIENYFEYSLVDPLLWTSTLAFKKSTFNSIGGFDSQLKTGQDIDLIIRFALKYKLGYNPEITLIYKKQTEHNLSSESALEEKYKYIKKHQKSELQHRGLKHYLDINRFSLALQAKLNKNDKLYRQVVSEIDINNLSAKQRFLLNCSEWTLQFLKRLQKSLIKASIYKSAFS